MGLRPRSHRQGLGAAAPGSQADATTPALHAGLLDRIDAPAALQEWLARPGRARPWQRCPRGDWMVWLAACSGHSLYDVLGAACDCVERAVGAMPAGTAPLLHALAIARQAQTAEACASAADDCRRAEREFPASYRATPASGYRAATRAAGWAARAAEGLVTAEARAEVRRADEATTRAVVIGMSLLILPAKAAGAARLDPAALDDDPVQQELGFVVAAAARAVTEATRALGPRRSDAPARKEAHASLAELVRRRLDDARLHARRTPP